MTSPSAARSSGACPSSARSPIQPSAGARSVQAGRHRPGTDGPAGAGDASGGPAGDGGEAGDTAGPVGPAGGARQPAVGVCSGRPPRKPGTPGAADRGGADGDADQGAADPAVADSFPAGPAVDDLVAEVRGELGAARASLAGVARRTRVVADLELQGLAGVPVWLKCEHEQHTRSFKLRGAYHRIARAGAEARARGVVAASAGNHAQGVAFAAARFGVEATIFVPQGANPVKVARTRRWGARVEYAPGGVDVALASAAAYAAEGDRLLVHPFDDPAVIAGQGTIGLELLEQVPDMSTVLVGVGGGGLVCGIAAAIRAHRPDVRIVGVQAAAAPAFAASLRAGRLLRVPPGTAGGGPNGEAGGGGRSGTIADGMAVARPGRLTFTLASRLVDEVVTVDEEAFWEAMVLLWRAGHQVEPAGAAGVAALLRAPQLAQGPTVAVLSGGNLDPAVASRVTALAAAPAAVG